MSSGDCIEPLFELPLKFRERMRVSLEDNIPPKEIQVPTPPSRVNEAELRRIIKTRLWGPEPPLTTTSRSSTFSEEQDVAYRIARWHYDFKGTRGEFWHNTDTATKRLRDQVFGIRPPTGQDRLDTLRVLNAPQYRCRENSCATQKKKLKRRKQILKKHRR